MKNFTSNYDDSPELACNISAITKEEMEEAMFISKEIFAITTEIRELADGYALSFPKTTRELISKLARFISFDSLCCPFIVHTMIVEANNGGTWLQLTGKKNVKAYVLGELNRELPKEVAKKVGFLKTKG